MSPNNRKRDARESAATALTEPPSRWRTQPREGGQVHSDGSERHTDWSTHPNRVDEFANSGGS
eukprot:4921753-Amphidinium_carterae.1